MLELGEDMAADLGQYLRLVGANVKHLLALFRREGIETHGENRQLAGAAGGFEQAVRVGVVARRGVGIDIAHAGNIVVIVGVAAIVQHIAIADPLVVESAEDLLRRTAEIDAQMVDQLQLAVGVNLCEQRHLGVGRPALHQGTAGVVADPADHRRADAR